jgi:nitroimidazol reductase NimA-like FMN-containing flavoprotein (pyridoxamine 5'-phosphate oxidase superfamily)
MDPRTRAERRKDTLRRLERDVDAWVATAADDGPYLMPLSFHWDGAALLFSTLATNPTGRNLLATGQARVALGDTRDVVMIEGAVTEVEPATAVADAFAARTGFDPRPLKNYRFFQVRPRHIQAWREVNELAGRDLMRDGEWI